MASSARARDRVGYTPQAAASPATDHARICGCADRLAAVSTGIECGCWVDDDTMLPTTASGRMLPPILRTLTLVGCYALNCPGERRIGARAIGLSVNVREP